MNKKLKRASKLDSIQPNDQKKNSVDSNLKEQYRVIRRDLLKLREDLSKGYEMAKKHIEKRTLLNELLGTR